MNIGARKRAFSPVQIVVRNKHRNQHGGTNVGRRTLEEGRFASETITDVRDEVASQQGAARP